jgi:short chain dehydrogenase
MVSLPSPTLQKVNALLHKEPIASIFYGLYWSTVFMIGLPFVVMFLQVQMVINVLSWLWTKDSKHNFHPNNKPEYDLAIVVTGCDTGFGKDIAIHCADIGYTVFAGCYQYESSKQLFSTIAKIIPFSLDVTKDKDVNEAARLVQQWLEEKNIPVQDIGRKRVLHAVINNAGIGTFGETCFLPLQEFKNMVDGMSLNCWIACSQTKIQFLRSLIFHYASVENGINVSLYLRKLLLLTSYFDFVSPSTNI